MRFMKTTAVALTIAVGALALTGTAEARHRNNAGAAVAAGIFGFAAGALVSGALSQPRYAEPDYYYAPAYAPPPPPPVYYARPAPVYYAAPDPWTRDWYEYCGSRYQSFDGRTGYFFGNDGQYHFCR